MARGRLLKTKRKEAYQLGKASEKGKLQAQREHQRKKHLLDSLKEHIGKAIDKADLPKMGAVIGMTVIIKQIIEASEELMKATLKMAGGAQFALLFPFARDMAVQQLTGAFATAEEFGKASDIPEVEVMQWLVSYTLAYLLVDNFGDIMQATGNALGSIKNMVSGLLLGGVGA